MLVVLAPNTSKEALDLVCRTLSPWGEAVVLSQNDRVLILSAVSQANPEDIARLPGVSQVLPLSSPYPLASRLLQPSPTIVSFGGVRVGGGPFVVGAGPCAVEDTETLLETARAVKAAGAHFLRGGAYKPRTNPYSFQGLEEAGLPILQRAKEETGLPIVTEVLDTRDVERVAKVADVLQVGARNSQNFALLKEVGATQKPVLLKRGIAARLEEFLCAAEYLLKANNPNVILCLRGVRGFETMTRYSFDVDAVPVLKAETHLPVLVDPSHALGDWRYIEPCALAALAAGADGLLIEVHPRPEAALSDGAQSLKPTRFATLVEKLKKVGEALGRPIYQPQTSNAVSQ